MPALQKDPLRSLAPDERRHLEHLSRSRTDPAAHVARAKELLAVADGASLEVAARAAGLKDELLAILATLPEPDVFPPEENRRCWQRWQEGLTIRITLPQDLPPVRRLLVWNNLTGHHTPDFVLWLFAHGIMPLFTPLGGSYLNMAESIQRILNRRALDGQHPRTPEEIIAWLEATARAWNREPTPFEWGGKRQARRHRARERRHAVGGSGAHTRRPLRRRCAA